MKLTRARAGEQEAFRSLVEPYRHELQLHTATGSSGRCKTPRTRITEPLWLEPYRDAMLEGIADRGPGPDVRYETKEAVALTFVTGL